MMFGLYVGLAVLVVLIGIALAVGASLPRDHVATVRARFAAPPAAVWAVIGDPLQASTWRKDVKTIERLPDNDGRRAWKEVSGNGAITYALVESVPEQRMVTRITDEQLPFGGQWEFSLQPAGSGAELEITERGFVKPAFFRVMARFVFGYTSSMENYLTSLSAKLGEITTPEVVEPGR